MRRESKNEGREREKKRKETETKNGIYGNKLGRERRMKEKMSMGNTFGIHTERKSNDIFELQTTPSNKCTRRRQ